jgi:acyl-CoA synthetase (AMP-forming)/AMP-acid ligase II
LFESIVLFENHPMDQPFPDCESGLQLRSAKVFEHTNYSLLLVYGPTAELPLILRFDPRRYDLQSMQREWLQQADYRCLVCDFADTVPKTPEGNLPVPRLAPKNRAYIIYTSGSTGRP